MSETKEIGGIPRRELTVAIAGGLTAGSALFAIIIGVGSVGDFQALRLIEATLPTTRFLASSAIAAGVICLAKLAGSSSRCRLIIKTREFGCCA